MFGKTRVLVTITETLGGCEVGGETVNTHTTALRIIPRKGETYWYRGSPYLVCEVQHTPGNKQSIHIVCTHILEDHPFD